MIFIIGSTLATFLGMLLLMKKGKTEADYLLLVWLTILAVHQILAFGEASEYFYRYPHLLALSFPIPLLHGVLLLLYVKSMVYGRRLKTTEVLLHLIPTFFLLALAMPFHLLSGEEKIAVFKNHGKGFETYLMFREILMFASGIGYVVWTLVVLRKHRASLENVYSNTEHKNLRWLQYLSIGLGLVWCLALFFDDTIIFTGVLGFVLFIGFYGIQQVPVFQSRELELPMQENSDSNGQAVQKSNPGEAGRYTKSGLKNEDVERIYAELQHLVSQKSPFKNPELTLTDLAKDLDIHPNYLSQVINEKEQKSFYHYINTLRTEEFLRLAARPDSRRFTLLALAYDCGFNSKTTFNKYFKDYTGKTPTDFFSPTTD